MRIKLAFLVSYLTNALAAPSTYRAPYNHHTHEDIVQQEYVISFHADHHLQKHFDFVGTDLSTDYDLFHDMPLINAYHIRCDDAMRDLIRSDPGVKRVAQNRKVYHVRNQPGNLTSGYAADIPSKNSKRWTPSEYWPRSGSPSPYWWIMMTSLSKVIGDVQEPWNFWRDAGNKVRIYIMDDGISLTHKAFNPDPNDEDNKKIGDTSRHAVNFHDEYFSRYLSPQTPNNPTTGSGNQDFGCHGTHVAALAGGLGYGTARSSTLVNVRVHNDRGEGTAADYTRAINDIVREHWEYTSKKDYKNWRGSVINMSFSFPKNEPNEEDLGSLRDAINLALRNGIPIVASAGNSGENERDPAWQAYPCQWSRDTDLICVGNLDRDYLRSRGEMPSNYGPQVSIWAPGKDILGPQCRDNNGERLWSGTSQATAFVSGVVASIVGHEFSFDVSMVKKRLYENANTYASDDDPEITHLVLNTGVNKGGPNFELPYFRAPAQPAESPQAPAPDGPQPLQCVGVDTLNWMGRDALAGVVPTFCDSAALQGGLGTGNAGGVTKGYLAIERTYLPGSVDEVSLSMDWPPRLDFRVDRAECNKYMTEIMDTCSLPDDQRNPKNWKHGGTKQVSGVTYSIRPQRERYTSGRCSFHVHEKVWWWGIDVDGQSRQWRFWLNVDIKDGSGKVVHRSNGFVEAGDATPYTYDGLFAQLRMTPEAQGDNYIQFDIGDQHWTTKSNDKSQPEWCDTGDWTRDMEGHFAWVPAERQMDCQFRC